MEMDRITNRLHIIGLESRINSDSDELQVSEVIICSPQDIKENLVATDSEGEYFGGFVCPYNILTCIQQSLKGGEILAEVFKHKKDLTSLNIYEDEAITV